MTPERRDEIALRVVSVVVTGSLALALAGLTWRLTGWDDGRDKVAVAGTLAPPGGAADVVAKNAPASTVKESNDLIRNQNGIQLSIPDCEN